MLIYITDFDINFVEILSNVCRLSTCSRLRKDAQESDMNINRKSGRTREEAVTVSIQVPAQCELDEALPLLT
jgi:hypothetical protein